MLLYISCNIRTYQLLQLFRTSFNFTWKKIFITSNFSFNGFTNSSPTPSLDSWKLLSVKKKFWNCKICCLKRERERERPFISTDLKLFTYQALMRKKSTCINKPHIWESDCQLCRDFGSVLVLSAFKLYVYSKFVC